MIKPVLLNGTYFFIYILRERFKTNAKTLHTTEGHSRLLNILFTDIAITYLQTMDK